MSDKIELLAPDQTINFQSFFIRSVGLLMIGDVLGNIIESITIKVEEKTGSLRLSGFFQMILNVVVIYMFLLYFPLYVITARDSVDFIFFHAAFFNSQTRFMSRITLA